MEAVRDDAHRQRMRLIWSEEKTVVLPATLEVLVLRGYLNHDLLLMQWQDGMVTASEVTVDRQWAYHAKPNARTYARVAMSAEEFTGLWQTIQYLLQVHVTAIDPLAEQAAQHAGHRTGGTSSHAPYHLLTWRSDPLATWSALPVLRGTSATHGIRDLHELKMAAITKVVWERYPKTTWIPDVEQTTAPRWLAWWRTVLPSTRGDGITEIDQRSQLLVDNACEMLSDLGDETDATLLASVATTLRPAVPRVAGEYTSVTYWEDRLRTTIANTTLRIHLQQHWDSAVASGAIHANHQRTFIDNDQDRWLRAAFHQQDPVGYLALLLNDLANADARLVVNSVKELLQLHPGQQQSELHNLLTHTDPIVVLTSALALLGKPVARYGWYVRADFAELCVREKHDPLLHDALTALDHLASDPTVAIPIADYAHMSNARTGAMEFLSACPLPWGWDDDRFRRQLDNPDEVDGRVIAHLIGRLQLPRLSYAEIGIKQPEVTTVTRALLISVWRRCLVTPYNRGTVLAIEELAAHRDLDSLPRLRQVIDQLRSGCATKPFNDGSDPAPFPWISRYEVDALEKRLVGMTPAPSTP